MTLSLRDMILGDKGKVVGFQPLAGPARRRHRSHPRRRPHPRHDAHLGQRLLRLLRRRGYR